MTSAVATSPWSLRRLGHVLGSQNRGWIGVDIGSSAIKFAQVMRERGEIRLLASRIAPLDRVHVGCDRIDVEVGDLLARELKNSPGFKGRTAACVLPMSNCELVSLELPDAPEQELRMMVEQEIESDTDSRSDCEYDFWTYASAGGNRQIQQVNVISLPSNQASQVAEHLWNAGLHCEVLDALPYCLARAVKLTNPSAGKNPIAVLDWGHTSASFMIVIDGKPAFARILRDCAYQMLLESISKTLSLAPHDAQQIVDRIGLVPDHETSADLKQALSDSAVGPYRQLIDEMNKTLSFLGSHYRDLVPESLVLFGGGATVKNIASAIQGSLNIPTSTWQLPGSTKTTDALFGPAVALSSIGGGVS